MKKNTKFKIYSLFSECGGNGFRNGRRLLFSRECTIAYQQK